MTWNDTVQPADWAINADYTPLGPPGRYNGNCFRSDRPLTFHLISSSATSYKVYDYYGTRVLAGSVSGTTLALPNLPLGWYRLHLHKAGAANPVYADLIGICSFCIVRPDSRFPDSPDASLTPQIDSLFVAGQSQPGGSKGGNPYHNWSNSFADHAGRGVAMLGPWRFDIQRAETLLIDPPDPSSGSSEIDKVLTDKKWYDAWYEQFQPDSHRPRPAFLQFPNGGYNAGQPAGVTTVVAACYPAGITHFEGPINEPSIDSQMTTFYTGRAADWVPRMQTFYNAVKAGNPNAKVMGPSVVTVNGYMLSALDKLFAAGAGAYLDAISFHFYNCMGADISLGRRTMDRFMAVLTKHGLQDMELWQTEYGIPSLGYGVFQPRQQAQGWMLQRLLLDQYGVPKERDSWFYDTGHGFWTYPSHWKHEGFNPMIPMTRVYSQELWGKTWAERLDFGTVENDHYVGSRYAATDGTSVLAMMSGGRTDGEVSLTVDGARSVVVVDAFGNTHSARVASGTGLVTIGVGFEPVYVRLPAGATATVLPRQYGTNIATWGVTPFGGSTATERRKMFNGYLEAWRYLGDEESRIEFRDDQTFPASVGGTFTTPHRIDTVVVNCPFPESNSCTLLDYDLEYQDTSGAWHVLETVTETPTVVYAPVWRAVGSGNFYDSYFSNRHLFVHEFAPVVAQAVRITVRATTHGSNETQAIVDAVGVDFGAKITVREISVYCRETQTVQPLAVVA